jgi:hypothetical protein
MRAILGVISLALVLPALAQDRSVDIDPNTKIQGGADLRGSGANAGAGATSDNKPQPDEKLESVPRIDERGDVARPDNTDPRKDKPISAREPRERERDEGTGLATPRQQQ